MRRLIAFGLAVLIAAVSGAQLKVAKDPLEWGTLPEIPDALGYGGPMAGVHNDALIVAGGANFSKGAPWEGGPKQWYSDIWVLPSKEATEWIDAGDLPHALAYGTAISTEGGVVLIGGQNDDVVYDEVLRLTWDPDSQKLSIEELPDLPAPTAFAAAGLMGDSVYVASGMQSSRASDDVHGFWKLDLSAENDDDPATDFTWQELDVYPGPARHKAVSAVQAIDGEDSFFLFSGEISDPADPSVNGLSYLTDGYRYDVKTATWHELNEIPHPIAAAAALAFGQAHVLVFSGSTGEHVTKPVQDRPRFTKDVLAYHTITDTWVKASEMPEAVVTTSAVNWDGDLVITSGEVKPGVRTRAVQIAKQITPPSGFGGWDWVVVAVYMGGLVWMGWWFSKREKSTDDFFLAGKRIPWWAAGLSIYATQLSAITYLSMPAKSFSGNWLIYWSLLPILMIAPFVIKLYLPFYRRLNVTSAYEYLEKRFGVSVRLYGALAFVAFQLARMAIVVLLPAQALTVITGLPIEWAIIIMGVVSIAYTVLGGIEAVVWTDAIQAIVLLVGLFISLGIVLMETGGPAVLINEAMSAQKFEMMTNTASLAELAWWTILIGSFFGVLGPYSTDQAVVQRYLTTKSEKAAAKGIWLNGLLSIPGAALFFLMGTALYVFFKMNPQDLSVGMNNDKVFSVFLASQLPVGLSGMVIAGVFAASMSSLDSSLHSVSTVAITDFYGRFGKNVTDASKLRLAKLMVVVVGIAAIGVSWWMSQQTTPSLLLAFQKWLGLLTSGLVGVFLMGIFFSRVGARGALAGALVSSAALWWVAESGLVNLYLYSIVGIGACLITGLLVSLTEKKGDVEGLTYWTLNKLEDEDAEGA
jgi:SSS family transporter